MTLGNDSKFSYIKYLHSKFDDKSKWKTACEDLSKKNPCGINTIFKISTTRGPDICNLKSYNLPMIFEGIFLSLFSNGGYVLEIIRIL